MRPQEIIQKKRDGQILSSVEIENFIAGVCDGTWADYQTSALLMACFVRGLDDDEQNFLTRAMLNSGEVLDFSLVGAPKADKHSTGGVGDKTSLIIAPVAAACGVAVPMISGRGLGHTGGTLDKLEAIPGYDVNLSTEKFRETVAACGFAMSGQTAEIAPADKKIYALRDATATVSCIPLIVASIMSKKLAEGLDVLVLDVKTGSGAFMRELEDSRSLARALVQTGNSFGVRTEAVISDMSEPLGKYVGNAAEVYECIKILRGEAELEMQPTLDLSIELTARMLVLAAAADSLADAKTKIQKVLDSGEGLEKFRENIECQNGDARVCDDPEMLISNDLIEYEIKAATSGFITEIDALAIGNAIVAIGGGRMKTSDPIDHAVGFSGSVKTGAAVKTGETLGVLYCRDENQARLSSENLRDAYKIGGENNLNQSRLIIEAVGK